ncbi:MAG: MBOAT family protein [Bacteroidaceae bacterium]|nr:MBOAT family protein [Bacteroidaceae bacterium]
MLLRKNINYQNVFLLLSSLFFYAWGEPTFVFVMLLSIVLNWGFGIWVDKKRENKTWILFLMLLFNLSLIFVFKYLMFAMNVINEVFDTHMRVPIINLPIGISFFTFQSISYVIDIYRHHGEVQRNPLNVGLYISFFPQLIAGPIVRYETIAAEINNRKVTWNDFTDGVERFIIGLGKKVLLANNFAVIADHIFSLLPEYLDLPLAWLGAISYTLQIFFDFSGYSDMAIGLGRMFGFHFLENFNYPYISRSVSEFWRRWHISLGSWFRDYVYIPLGGNRVAKPLVYRNLFVVWLLTGIWHGANWTFIVWGLMYFVLLAFEKFTELEKRNFHILGHVYTLFFVVVGWVIFRSETLTDAWNYLHVMFTPSIPNSSPLFLFYISEYKWWLLCGLFFSIPIVNRSKLHPVINSIWCIVIFFLCLVYITKGGYNPFIYFNF